MAQINVTNLTFCYEGSFDPVFDNVSFSVDTNWKLGLIGRNGKGKTTFLNLLMGKYTYQGTIHPQLACDYFPYALTEAMQQQCAAEFLEELKAGCELWRVICELDLLGVEAEVLYRPFATLSHGERTKVLLALLFSGEDDFVLVDEPTNHLDQEARDVVKAYLQQKKSFLLVSHDRDLLDASCDHVLVLNRRTIEVQRGNFSSWQENKQRRDHCSRQENEKHLREIASLKRAAAQRDRWAQKSENSKIGYDPIKDHDRGNGTRPYIGAKTKKLESQKKHYEQRMEWEIQQEEGLLEDLEEPVDLKLCPLSYHKETLLYAREFSLRYGQDAPWVLRGFGFELKRGERVFLHGSNGCGKSSFLKAILSGSQTDFAGNGSVCAAQKDGTLVVGSGLVISYVNQDTSFLRGDLQELARQRGLEISLFFALLRKLDLERTQFRKPLEDFSEGQKKKVLLAASLMTPAHLYIWDEPLNYIDVFTRMQIEELLLRARPTMLVVEHDVRFREKIATRVAEL